MRKFLALVLVVVTLGTMLVACGKGSLAAGTPGSPIPEKRRKAMEKREHLVWYDGKEENRYTGDRHYGTFNGCTVVFRPGAELSHIIENTYAGFPFRFQRIFSLHVYNGVYFISVRQALDDGLLTEDDVEVMYNYHKSIFTEYYK